MMNNDTVLKKEVADDIFKDFCNWSPGHASMTVSHAYWGKHSIIIWLVNGMMYKCKRYDKDRFVMQSVTVEDINKKFNIIK